MVLEPVPGYGAAVHAGLLAATGDHVAFMDGDGSFDTHGISATVPLLAAFLGSCVVLAIGGGLLLVPRSIGVVTTLAGIVVCAPFWWGFDLPLAWLNAATVLALLSLAAPSLLGTIYPAPDTSGS